MRYWVGLVILVLAAAAGADELRPAYLQLTQVESDTYRVYWKVPARGLDQRLGLQAEFGGGATTVQSALEGFVGDAYVRQSTMRFPGGLANTRIEIAGLAQTSTDVLLRIEYRDGTSVAHRFTPDAPGYTVAAKPTLAQTAWTYLVLGVEHILIGVDHLLFVLVLLLLIANTRKLIATITAFTVAHSITLSLAALEIVHIPVPPVEACIALSIVFVAAEILHAQQGRPGIAQRRPWIVAFVFGLLHGLGFAAALGEIGLPQNAVPTALVLFNIGVEIGQLIFIAAILFLRWLTKGLAFPPWWRRVPPYAAGSLASFWVIERTVGFWT